MTPAANSALATWGRPPDLPAKVALGAAAIFALAAAIPAAARALGLLDLAALRTTSRRRFVTTAAFAAAFLSLAYIAVYLRGGPRIIDATAYWLQGRALSRGMIAFPDGDVSASLRGRFLLAHDGKLAGAFPPGYPLLLALGFLLGAPMVMGPALAAALVVATYALAREAAREARLDDDARELVARGAALLSIASAALRYHTADTMSHGAAALGVTTAVLAALVARRDAAARGAWAFWWAAGLAAGWVLATRLASGAALLAVVGALAITAAPAARARAVILSTVGAVPGLALLLAAQRAATGTWFTSTQLAYYAQADGPPGCFRWGFGAHVGCLQEHGEYVRQTLPRGFGPLEALRVTGRRLWIHATDAANAGPLALPALATLVLAPRAAAVRACAGVFLALVLVYLPFYFDGSYPGAGARLYADALPLEHVLLALGAVLGAQALAPHLHGSAERATHALVAAAFAAFGTHAVFDHRALAARDGGGPMFDPEVLKKNWVDKGVVFFDTDHGWNLAFDPAAKPDKGFVALRRRGDDHDRAAVEALGNPAAYAYRFHPETGPENAASAAPAAPHADATGQIVPWSPPWTPSSSAAGYLFEAEAEWPPLGQAGGWAEPVTANIACASGGKALAIRVAAGEANAAIEIELPVPQAGEYLVTPRLVASEKGPGTRGPTVTLSLLDGPSGAEVAMWRHVDGDAPGACVPLAATRVTLARPAAHLRVLTSSDALLDAVELARPH